MCPSSSQAPTQLHWEIVPLLEPSKWEGPHSHCFLLWTSHFHSNSRHMCFTSPGFTSLFSNSNHTHRGQPLIFNLSFSPGSFPSIFNMFKPLSPKQKRTKKPLILKCYWWIWNTCSSPLFVAQLFESFHCSLQSLHTHSSTYCPLGVVPGLLFTLVSSTHPGSIAVSQAYTMSACSKPFYTLFPFQNTLAAIGPNSLYNRNYFYQDHQW